MQDRAVWKRERKKRGTDRLFQTGARKYPRLSEGFAKKYPFVKVDRRGSRAQRDWTDPAGARVGKFQADVIGVDFDNIDELLKGGVLARYDSPEKKVLCQQFWDKEGLWYAPIIRCW